MEGQVKFFITENAWRLIRDPETNNEYHVHISDVAGRTALERNAWVSFDIASRKGKGTSAINVVPIDCPARYLLQGTITRFVENKGFGFIRYGRAQSVFFHVKDFLQVDGVSPVPCVGCTVSFFLGRKSNQQIAAQIWIEAWPEGLTIEEQFAAAEELPIDVAEPIVAPQSVLAPATKNLSLIEIVNRQRRKREKS